MQTEIFILAALLVLSAFFEGAEIALASVSAAKVRQFLEKKASGAKSLAWLKENPRRFIGAIIISNTFISVTISVLATVITIDLFGKAAVGIATGMITLVVLVFGQVLPKTLAAAYSERLSLSSAPILQLLARFLLPFIIIFDVLPTLILKMLGKKKEPSVTEDELRFMARLAQEEGTIEAKEREMLESLFRFNDVTAEDVMTPRVEMFCVETNQKIADVLRKIITSTFSRIPVYEKTVDHIVGIVHARDILRHVIERRGWKAKLGSVAREPFFVPYHMTLSEILRQFQERNIHMAIVLDPYGGTEGLVTLEDLLEELVGEIIDEKDVTPELIMRIDKNTILVDARTELRAVNRFLNIRVSGEELETVSGFALRKIGRIPGRGEQFTVNGLTFTIHDVDKRKIRRVKIAKTHPQ